MSVNLVKGQKISLVKEENIDSIKQLTVGLGWDVNKKLFGHSYDLDAHAMLEDENGKQISHIYYGNKKFKDAVRLSGDNLTGEGDGDDEQIFVNLSALPKNVAKITFAVVIFEARSRKQTFGEVKNAYIRIATPTEELCKYSLTDNYEDKIAVVAGEIYRHNGEWKFNPIGEGYSTEPF